MLSSMSECKKFEGPETTITGKVIDAYTSEGYANVHLKLVRQIPSIDMIRYEDFDSVVTDNFGSYRLKFTPALGQYRIQFKDNDIKKYGIIRSIDASDIADLKLGESNTVDFKVSKLIELKINLKNSSDYNYNNFLLESTNCYCVYYQASSVSITKDTIVSFSVPRYTTIKFKNTFYTDKKPEFKSTVFTITTLGSDTTVFVNN